MQELSMIMGSVQSLMIFLKWQHFRYPLPEVDFKYRK